MRRFLQITSSLALLAGAGCAHQAATSTVTGGESTPIAPVAAPAAAPALASGPAGAGAREATEAVVRVLEGIMDSSQQAATQQGYANVRLTNCRIAIDGALPAELASLASEGAVWMYQEQAMASTLDQPYRQRVLILRPGTRAESVESHLFDPGSGPSSGPGTDPSAKKQLIGLCSRSESERRIPAALLSTPMCRVDLVRSSDQYYVGSTPPEGCPNDWRGAVKVTNETVFTPEGMVSWDRGWDANGRQVWGAVEGPYYFRKIGNAGSADGQGEVPLEVRKLAGMLTGAFDNRAQVARDRKYPAIEQVSCPVYIAPAEAEQFTGKLILGLETRIPGMKIYRQHYWLIGYSKDGESIDVQTYIPPPTAVIPNLCRLPDEGRRVTTAQMGQPACTVHFTPMSNGRYRGRTGEGGCPNSMASAAYMTAEHDLGPDGMNVLDRGFDSNGKEVWGPAVPTELRRPLDEDIEEVARRLTGKLDSSAQAARDKRYMTVKYNNCQVTVKNNTYPGDERLLFAEQILTSDKLSFARRRLLRIHRTDGGATLVTDFRALVNDARFTGLCNRPAAEHVIDISDIGDTECGVFFQRHGDTYVGTTRNCKSAFQGADTLIINGRLEKDGLYIWERWYDKYGKQVAGATDGPYEYRRVSP